MSELFADAPAAPPTAAPAQPPAPASAATAAGDDAYLVLARKYRPQTFTDLVGQEALVRTLENAIQSNRIHHAYVLTGIRGVGKTTTARILAKALNCENGPSVTWADDDAQCQAIANGRHVDVLEFDAASHTGVDDMRQLFEGVGYLPVQGRYKIYIIDEVHMLSRQAFNALLKTLEEPPAHVKFIFATTEAHKIPVTVLSRCQRFDLRRIAVAELQTHFTKICAQEGVQAEPAAISLVARAAEGSVRDGLSLLDQAMALAGDAPITAELVATMIGKADAERLYTLLENLLAGDVPAALAVLRDLYTTGTDPLLLLNELMTMTHLLTRLKVVPGLKTAEELTEQERTRGVALADRLSLENLGRAYQLLLTAAAEAKQAPRPIEAVEMALVRVGYLAPLPAVATLLQQVQSGVTQPAPQPVSQPAAAPAPAPQPAPAPAAAPQPKAGGTPPWEDDAPAPAAEAASAPKN